MFGNKLWAALVLAAAEGVLRGAVAELEVAEEE